MLENEMKFLIEANPEFGGALLRLYLWSEETNISLSDTSNDLLMPSSFAYDKKNPRISWV